MKTSLYAIHSAFRPVICLTSETRFPSIWERRERPTLEVIAIEYGPPPAQLQRKAAKQPAYRL